MTWEDLSHYLRVFLPGLKDHLWQSTAFAVGAALLAHTMRQNFARTRYWVWMAASIKFVLPFSILMTVGAAVNAHRPQSGTIAAVYDTLGIAEQPFTTISTSAFPSSKKVETLYTKSTSALVLAAVWLVGTLTVLTMWSVAWWRVRTAVHCGEESLSSIEAMCLHELQQKVGFKASIRLKRSDEDLVPGIYGIARPVLLWPSRISQHLDANQIEAILAHELCHVKRRDNLTACFHMLVEALFWFHPLVWWLGVRLEQERERACDERVVQWTAAPHTYATSILKVCELCVMSPLACVSGVTSTNLKERIRRIMTSQPCQRLTLTSKLLLTVGGLSSVAVPVIFSQTPINSKAPSHENLRTATQSFDVATIKPVENGPKTPRFIKLEGTNRFVVRDYNLKLLIAAAYNMNPKTISGGPAWTESNYYDIVATIPGLPNPTREAQMAMLRTLLEDRFHLKYHREPKEFPIYALGVAKDGPKLKATSLSSMDAVTVGPRYGLPPESCSASPQCHNERFCRPTTTSCSRPPCCGWDRSNRQIRLLFRVCA